MKKLPPAKQKQLIGVLVGTIGLICAVYFLLISPQDAKNHKLALFIRQETDRLEQYQKIITKKQETTETLALLTDQLQHAEQDVASGDLYAWTYDTIRPFIKAGFPKLETPTLGQPALSDCDLIAGFPYRQIRFALTGSGYYHDLGKFIADFENKFPHCRVVNLSLDPVNAAAGTAERLNFRMDIIALVKPNT